MRTGLFPRAGLIVAIASEFGFAINAKPVSGGVEVTASPSAWSVILRELRVEMEDSEARPEHRRYAQELQDILVAARLTEEMCTHTHNPGVWPYVRRCREPALPGTDRCAEHPYLEGEEI